LIAEGLDPLDFSVDGREDLVLEGEILLTLELGGKGVKSAIGALVKGALPEAEGGAVARDGLDGLAVVRGEFLEHAFGVVSRDVHETRDCRVTETSSTSP